MSVETELYRAAMLTFEELSLMLPAPGIEPWQRKAPLTSAVRIDFSGPLEGSLVVSIYGDLLPAMAANMLGQDNAPSREEQLDALGEVANVICGNALPGIGGVDAVFQIASPRIISTAEAVRLCTDRHTQVQVGLDQGYANICLLLN